LQHIGSTGRNALTGAFHLDDGSGIDARSLGGLLSVSN